MTRRRTLGSITEVGHRTYRVMVSAGRDPRTGRRIRLTASVAGSKRDAERELSRMLLQAGRVSAASKTLTVREYLLEMYLPAIEPTVRLKTFAGYESKLRIHVLPHIGNVPVAELGSYHIDAWRAKLVRKHVHPTTIMHAHRALHTALRRAVAWGVIDRDPMAAMTAPTPGEHEPTILTADELNAMLDAVAGDPLEPIVVLAVAAGLRRSELCGLKWSDIDLDAAEVRIRRGLHEQGDRVWTEPPKSKTSKRDVTLPAWAVDALRTWRGIGPIIGDARPSDVSRNFRQLLRRHGLRDVPLRDLRHTHGTLLLEQGVDLLVVSRRLGHSTTAVSERFYLRVRRSADKSAADRFQGVRRVGQRPTPSVPSRANSTTRPGTGRDGAGRQTGLYQRERPERDGE